MTVSLKIHVNGRYRATVKHKAGEYQQPDTIVGPQEEEYIFFQHGVVNELVVTEEYLGEEKPTQDDPNSELTTSK